MKPFQKLVADGITGKNFGLNLQKKRLWVMIGDRLELPEEGDCEPDAQDSELADHHAWAVDAEEWGNVDSQEGLDGRPKDNSDQEAAHGEGHRAPELEALLLPLKVEGGDQGGRDLSAWLVLRVVEGRGERLKEHPERDEAEGDILRGGGLADALREAQVGVGRPAPGAAPGADRDLDVPRELLKKLVRDLAHGLHVSVSDALGHPAALLAVA
mmetsp:Transcript_3445/g.8531  ORF Transcript_3445/g.8531 Transcript_3445/m.8531 type:complete len:213 (+) Transcript_3445:15-653(+)